MLIRKSQRLATQQWTQDNASADADINSVPEPILITIIQLLPWRDRVWLEQVNKRWRHLALTHGWSDVICFDSEEVAESKWCCELGHGRQIEAIRQFPTRCGSFVHTLHLQSIGAPIELLELCLNVRHVTFTGMRGNGELLDYLLEECERRGKVRGFRYEYSYLKTTTYIAKSRSFSFIYTLDYIRNLPKLNQLLAACNTLVSLCIKNCQAEGRNVIEGLQFPAHLLELRLCDELYYGHVENRHKLPLLNDDHVRTLATGELRSLWLNQPNPLKLHDYLYTFNSSHSARYATHTSQLSHSSLHPGQTPPAEGSRART